MIKLEIPNKQVEVLLKVLAAVETETSLYQGSDIYLCHEICEAFSPETSYRMEGWDEDEATVLSDIWFEIKDAIHGHGTVETYLKEGLGMPDEEACGAKAKQFRLDLVRKMLADRGVNV